MSYGVVLFLNENANGQCFQEVPIIWLKDNNTSCWWPPNNVAKHIAKCTIPGDKWILYKVQLKNVYDNLEKARRMCLEESNNSGYSDAEVLGKHFRKKTESYKHQHMDKTCISPPPSLFTPFEAQADSSPDSNHEKSVEDRTYLDLDTHSDIAVTPSLKPKSGTVPRTRPVQKYKCTEEMSSSFRRNDLLEYSQEYQCNSLREQTHADLGKEIEEYPLRHQQLQQINAHVKSNDTIIILKKLDAIYRMVHELKLDLQDIKERGLSSHLPPHKSTSTLEANKFKYNFKNLFPLSSVDDANKLSAICDGDDKITIKNELILYCRLIGGDGPKEHHTRIFKKMFTNAFGELCTWKGNCGNFKVEDLNFIRIVMDLFQNDYNTNEKEFETFSRNWLRHCKARRQREQANI